MKSLHFPLKYFEETGRTLNIEYKEHIHAIRSNSSNSGYSDHILNSGHAYETITDAMVIIKRERKANV